MEILLTNDDGIASGALKALAVALAPWASVTVVAPEREQSGVGHAFTYFKPLRYEVASGYPCPAFHLDGTPADCIKFAICELRGHKRPDLVISGINNGENSGVSAIYSGTVAGAREGVLWNVPAIALSAVKLNAATLSAALAWIVPVVREGRFSGMPAGVFWNVNFPDCEVKACAGIRIGSMSGLMFTDHYRPVSEPDGSRSYQLDGEKRHDESPEGSDDWWLHRGYATLSPLQIDQTSPTELNRLLALWPEGESIARSTHV